MAALDSDQMAPSHGTGGVALYFNQFQQHLFGLCPFALDFSQQAADGQDVFTLRVEAQACVRNCIGQADVILGNQLGDGLSNISRAEFGECAIQCERAQGSL